MNSWDMQGGKAATEAKIDSSLQLSGLATNEAFGWVVEPSLNKIYR